MAAAAAEAAAARGGCVARLRHLLELLAQLAQHHRAQRPLQLHHLLLQLRVARLQLLSRARLARTRRARRRRTRCTRRRRRHRLRRRRRRRLGPRRRASRCPRRLALAPLGDGRRASEHQHRFRGVAVLRSGRGVAAPDRQPSRAGVGGRAGDGAQGVRHSTQHESGLSDAPANLADPFLSRRGRLGGEGKGARGAAHHMEDTLARRCRLSVAPPRERERPHQSASHRRFALHAAGAASELQTLGRLGHRGPVPVAARLLVGAEHRQSRHVVSVQHQPPRPPLHAVPALLLRPRLVDELLWRQTREQRGHLQPVRVCRHSQAMSSGRPVPPGPPAAAPPGPDTFVICICPRRGARRRLAVRHAPLASPLCTTASCCAHLCARLPSAGPRAGVQMVLEGIVEPSICIRRAWLHAKSALQGATPQVAEVLAS